MLKWNYSVREFFVGVQCVVRPKGIPTVVVDVDVVAAYLHRTPVGKLAVADYFSRFVLACQRFW